MPTRHAPLPEQIALRMIARGLWDRVLSVPSLPIETATALLALALLEVINGCRGREADDLEEQTLGPDVLDIETHRLRPLVDGGEPVVVRVVLDCRDVIGAVITSPDGGVFQLGDYADVHTLGPWY